MQFSYKSILTAAVVFTHGVFSFGDTSPHLLMASTKELDNGLKKAQFSSFVMDADRFDHFVATSLSDCPADAYVFINQPALHSYDLAGGPTPSLRQLYDSATSKYIFPNVANSDSSNTTPSNSLANTISSTCNAKLVSVNSTSPFESYIDTTPRVIVCDLPTLPSRSDATARLSALKSLDSLVDDIVHQLPSPNYVLILTSSPVSDSASPVIADPDHVEKIRKHLVASAAPANEFDEKLAFEREDVLDSEADTHPEPTEKTSTHSISSQSTGVRDDDSFVSENSGLFERYQFFSPGIFESTLISFLLIGIFFTSYNWISSLQITYKAFEKTPEIGGSSKAQ